MKFLTKINRQYIYTLSILLLLVSVLGYFVLQRIIINEIKEDILEKEYAIINEIKTKNNTPNVYPIILTEIIDKSERQKATYKKINLYDEAEDEVEPYIEYTNTVKINNWYYLIKLRHSLLDISELAIAISIPLFSLLILVLVVSFVTTIKMNKTVWNDFENNLKEIENFSFNKLQSIKLKQTNIEEFNRLNSTVTHLTQKLQHDYKALKEFTENASHEIQTPISIISLNLDEILQQNLSEQVFKQVITTQNAVKRLSNLNKNLLLLTKINNKQYPIDNNWSINNLINIKIIEFKPLLKSKKIKISYNQDGNFIIRLNTELAEIMLNNLISNAIEHNIDNGKILINISEKQLQICNTGKENSLTNSNIFSRFTKENSQSCGLGLSIVKQICDTHKLKISYKKNELHCFTITSTT